MAAGNRRVVLDSTIALAGVAATLALLRASSPLFAHHEPLLPLMLPVMGAAVLGGAIPGVIATLAATLAGNYLFIEPVLTLGVQGDGDRADLVLFALIGLGISVLGEWSARLLAEARRLHAQLQSESQRLAQVVATVPGAVCALQQRPDGSVSFPYASPRIEEIYGVSAEALRHDGSAGC